MIPLILLTVQYCIFNNATGGLNGTASNVSSFTGLLQFENNSPCLYGNSLLGFGILAIILVLAFGSLALKVDVAVAGAVAGWIGIPISLLLIQLGLLNANVVGIALAINMIMTIIVLLRGAANPY